jgi:uncharacterized protein (DUF433 family)
MPKLDRITVNPHLCPGQPAIRGTRMTVSVILERDSEDACCR